YTPLIADIHFTPNAAEIAARIVEKVRVNPGNYVDKKKFELIDYTDADYAEEIERIQERFTPLVKICKEYGTAMRIGTNHGSLSDRIMSRYGDTPMGMVESAMEFLRIARYESYHNIVLSMKSSNPQVMVAAYRLLIKNMQEEFGEIYPLHLGVTEAGDGEDGRIKSAVGIGTLLEDGIGDTIRVSLTEDPELEIPVCKDLVKRYSPSPITLLNVKDATKAPSQRERESDPALISRYGQSLMGEGFSVGNIGGHHVPVVIADLSKLQHITPESLENIGYTYNSLTDKWTISDSAADYIFTANQILKFALPGTLKVIVYHEAWLKLQSALTQITEAKYFPIYEAADFVKTIEPSKELNFVMIDCGAAPADIPYLQNNPAKNSTLPDMEYLSNNPTVVICLSSTAKNAMQLVRAKFIELRSNKIGNPIIFIVDSNWQTADEHLIHFSIEAGALLLDGMGDGICLGMGGESYDRLAASYVTTKNQSSSLQNGVGRSYLKNNTIESFINNTAFGILQATRKRISKTEYISCPSCGRTLFDLQETTAKIRAVTNHLKGV
ncbi:MAG: (E)-4-hydroxy-3-methylbut-2-enyl-diphosphate synthase, partial [Bacteroidota bacterium]